MRTVIFATLATATLAANIHDRAYYEEKFFNWLQEHRDRQPRAGEHFVRMLQNFANNDDIIEQHNTAGNSTYKLGHNQFSHMSRDEWRAFIRSSGFVRPSLSEAFGTKCGIHKEINHEEDSIDWVKSGAVTAVKDQGQCGSCWAFSTTGALEGAYANVKGNSLTAFSEQHLVDCDNFSGTPRGSDHGCNGGLMDNAFQWISKNGGIATEESYPYVSGVTAKGGTCDPARKDIEVIEMKSLGCMDVPANNNDAFKSALAKSPVAIAIQADQIAFQLYKSGVFSGTCGDKLDHGVLAVAYGTDPETKEAYYTVKNSWGDKWGEKGYIRFIDDASLNKGAGQCGILASASYPTIE